MVEATIVLLPIKYTYISFDASKKIRYREY